MEGTTLGTFSTGFVGETTKSRPSRLSYDTERFNSGVFSPLGSMTHTTNGIITDSNKYKWWLIALYNRHRDYISDEGVSTSMTFPAINDRDVITKDRGNPYVTSKYNNPIWHLVNRGSYNGFAWGAVRPDGWCEARGYEKRTAPCPYTQFVPLVPDHDLYLELRLARGRAHATMAPKIKAQVMGLVFLLELPECMLLVKLLVSLVKNTLRLNQKFGNLWSKTNTPNLNQRDYHVRDKKRRALQESYDESLPSEDPSFVKAPWGSDPLTGSAAAAYLTYQLALKPLMSDLEEISDLVKNIKAKYKAAKVDREFNPHHYTEVLYECDERVRLESGSNYAISRGKYLTTRFHAESWLTYKGFGGSFEEFVKLISGMVINLPTIWESIPFSFLVDYVFRIGKALERLDSTGLQPYIVDDYLETVKMESSYGDHFDDRLLFNFVVHERATKLSQNKLFSGWSRTIYNRTPTWPYKGLVIPQLRMPNLRQAGIVAALLRAWS